MNYSRGAPYSYNDWLRDIRVELDIPPGGSEAYLRDKAKYDKIKKASRVKVNKKCPPGYKYRSKRKPGQRKCAKEKVRIYLSFLQKMAKRNGISIFKLRKDKRGYTRTLLTIPQLKSRLTRNRISYKMNNTSKFGMAPLMALSLASSLASSPMARSAVSSLASSPMARSMAMSLANRELEKAKKKSKGYMGSYFGVLPMGGGKGPEEPEDPRIAAYAIEKKQKIAEQNRKWRAAKAAETADKYEAVREAGMDRAAADAIRYMGMTQRERLTAKAKERRELGKRAKEYMAQQAAAQALLASASGAGSSSSGAGPSSAGLDFTIPDVDFGRTRYNYNYYGTQEMWQ
jgi:hypothetical protein